MAPGSAPAHWRRRAVAVFRRLGAGPAAGRLEARDTGAWGALAAGLARPPGVPGAGAVLLADAGFGAVRRWGEAERDARVLGGGAGGEERLAAPAAGGTLVLTAPWTDDVLRALFRVALRDLVEADGSPAASPSAAAGRADGIVGSSPALLAALERLDLLAPGELPIFIHGESGTGKELAARRVHRLSARREQPFVAINCAALSESLLLSDLFGHVRGAFTGAERDRAGVFETAAGGTVFLDEIGDLPANAQGMLLRVLQEGEVRRVGESLPRRVHVRVVAASHRDLEAMAAEGAFRQDLYYRLCAAAVALPPLRERGGDAVEIAEHLLARRSPPGGGAPPRLASAARERIANHRWPGNVRELENVLGVAAALAGGGVVGPQHLELPAAAEGPSGDYHRQVESLRRRLVEEALAAAGGNRAEAARRLGLSRQALSYLVRKLRIG
jgi:transcriptional regulator with GAF, ATPase, and Fis domain